MFPFYMPWKRQKIFGIEMEHWNGTGNGNGNGNGTIFGIPRGYRNGTLAKYGLNRIFYNVVKIILKLWPQLR